MTDRRQRRRSRPDSPSWPTDNPAACEAFVEVVRAGDAEAADRLFDGLLPRRLRAPSRQHWSPAEAGLRVAQLISPAPGERVLDVGSGVGKLCIVAALATQGSWVGVEQRPNLVKTATRLAEATGATGATFLRADAFDLDWTPYRTLYFYNPFAELDLAAGEPIDYSIPTGVHRYDDSTRKTLARLQAMPPGTRVVVLFDLGVDFPPCYSLRSSEQLGESTLALWERSG